MSPHNASETEVIKDTDKKQYCVCVCGWCVYMPYYAKRGQKACHSSLNLPLVNIQLGQTLAALTLPLCPWTSTPSYSPTCQMPQSSFCSSSLLPPNSVASLLSSAVPFSFRTCIPTWLANNSGIKELKSPCCKSKTVGYCEVPLFRHTSLSFQNNANGN